MNILVVSNMYPSARVPSYGTFVRNFVEDIKARNGGGAVDVCTIYGRRMSKLSKAGAYASYYLRLLWALATSRHDLIYVHAITFPSPALRLVSLFRHLPLVLNVHGDDVLPSNGFKRRLKKIATPLVYKAAMIVSPSRYFAQVVEREFPGLDPSKIFISPSGGLKPMFYRPKETVTAEGAPLTLGFVSRIDPGKKWRLFIDAVSRLNSEGVDCVGVMAGGGSEAPQVAGYIASRGMTGKITYLGPQPQEELPGLYHSFDVMVFATVNQSESLGLVGLEAMAAGTPVIASRMAGPRGYVDDGVNGFLFTPGSLDDLCRAVKDYMSLDSAARLAMSRAAYTTALGYEADHVGSALYNRLKSL